MAQTLKTFLDGMSNFIKKESKDIDSLLKNKMTSYRTQLSAEIESALFLIPGTDHINREAYYYSENLIIDRIAEGMQNWWDSWIQPAEDLAYTGYSETKGIALDSMKKLFTIDEVEVPVSKIVPKVDTKSGGSLDLATGELKIKEDIKPKITLQVGSGGISSEFEQYLKQQFNAGLDPRNAITTFSARDIARIRGELIRGLREGVDTTVVRKRLVKKLVSKAASPEVRRKAAINIRRILRTTFQNASIAAAFAHAEGNPAVQSLVRHTGPRPCVACIALSGKTYGTASAFRDHPNGQCYVTYVMKDPEELGINWKSLNPKTKKSWLNNFAVIPNRKYSFLKASSTEQRKIFANNSLYDLWKNEKFPLEALAHNPGDGTFVQISYVKAIEKLHTFGGVSYPKSKFISNKVKEKFLFVMDPYDRANSRITIYSSIPNENTINRYGKDYYPENINSEMIENATGKSKSKIEAITEEFGTDIRKIPWYAYNDLSRALDLGIRKASNRVVYYIKPN